MQENQGRSPSKLNNSHKICFRFSRFWVTFLFPVTCILSPADASSLSIACVLRVCMALHHAHARWEALTQSRLTRAFCFDQLSIAIIIKTLIVTTFLIDNYSNGVLKSVGRSICCYVLAPFIGPYCRARRTKFERLLLDERCNKLLFISCHTLFHRAVQFNLPFHVFSSPFYDLPTNCTGYKRRWAITYSAVHKTRLKEVYFKL